MRRGLIPVLAAGHGLNDLLAGYFLGCFTRENPDPGHAAAGLFIYNLLAFGGQYPLALWLEKWRNRKSAITGAYALNVAAAGLFPFLPALSVVLAGVASALYHVAGGAVCAGPNKASFIGLFAAPGVAGLILGGYAAVQGWELQWVLCACSLLFFFLLLFFQYPDSPSAQSRATVPAGPDRHDLVMILLLSVIAFRSALWNIFQLLHEQQFDWLFAIGLSAAAGKIIGGWIADRVGWRLYIYLSLFTATPLIHFFKNELLPFCIGIGLLQSGIPATTALLIQSVRGKTERGIGLAFGTAIILGAVAYGLPAGFYNRAGVIPLIILLLMLLLFYRTHRFKRLPAA